MRSIQLIVNVSLQLWTFKEKFADPKMAKGCDDACLDKLRLLTNGDIENNFFD